MCVRPFSESRSAGDRVTALPWFSVDNRYIADSDMGRYVVDQCVPGGVWNVRLWSQLDGFSNLGLASHSKAARTVAERDYAKRKGQR